jgi:hypothetical protein
MSASPHGPSDGVDAYFVRDDGLFVPGPPTASGWAADTLDGRSVLGLVAHAVERDHLEPHLRVARLTVDLFRAAPKRPLGLRSRAVRSGRRVRAVDVEVLDGDVPVARATALLLALGDQPTSVGWAWPVAMPGPAEVASSPAARPGWEIRRVDGFVGDSYFLAGQGRVWIHEGRQFVAGEPMSPLVAVAMAADFTNHLANAGPEGLAFINADVTLHLGRLPRGEWVGLESTGHVSADGVAVGSAALSDEDGPVGMAAVSGLADPRWLARMGRGAAS